MGQVQTTRNPAALRECIAAIERAAKSEGRAPTKHEQGIIDNLRAEIRAVVASN